jgi:hypothetical protein
MQKLEPIELLDEVLNFIKIGEYWKTRKVIDSHFRSINIELTHDDLDRIIIKLMGDNYIDQTRMDDYTKDHYTATYDGILFHGYVKQRLLDNERLISINQMAIATKKYNTRLLWATCCAGIAAALLLLWQVVVWVYPKYDDFHNRNLPKKSIEKSK